MATNDVDIIQSFCRRYINRLVKEHFNDVEGNDDGSLSLDVPRQVIKRICLHKDKDSLMLTTIRLLIWWVEARGLIDEYIYGIPSTDFEIKFNYYPQVKLHFKESRYESSNNDRRPIRSEVSFRWREDDFSTSNITTLANKIAGAFTKPAFKFSKGRLCYTYWDDQKGYRFTLYTSSETEARNIIQEVIKLQDPGTPDWDNNFREHKDNKNYLTQETVRIMGETRKKPKRRPVGTVEFQYAELFIPGSTKPIILVDRTGYKPWAIKYV